MKATVENAKDKSLQEAKKAIEEEKQERMKKCQTELSDLLKKRNCRLDAYVVITQQGNMPQIKIVALDE